MVAGEIDDLASGVIRIGKGDFTVRFERGGGGEMDRLRGAIDDAAEELGGRFDAMADHAAKLDAILDNTQNSIIGLDAHGNILLINNAARKRFNVRPGEEVRGHSLLKVVRNAQINGLVERSIRDNSRSETEIVFRQGDDDRILKVFVKPLDLEARVAGDLDTIVYINDVTELRNLEKVRTDFASNVTHELKTPLTSIRGFIETLKDGAIRDPAVASGFLDIIDIEAERLHALIQDVLYLSEIESGRKESDPGSCDVGAQIEEVVRLLEKEAEKYGVRVAKGPTEGVRVRANPDRIRQMLINLVGNAIKYNKPGGSVTVSCLRTAEGAVVSVKDTGIGIEKKHLGRIFERFYRVDAGRSRDVGGTGLGLAIVKHIAQLYGGAVRVESAPGEGSEFTVVFP
jgi:two-component system phosphate regulon sensor histidine kinase PhoR